LELKPYEKKIIQLAKSEQIKINTCTGCLSGNKESLDNLLTDKNLKNIYHSYISQLRLGEKK
jgi:hypothetical protein